MSSKQPPSTLYFFGVPFLAHVVDTKVARVGHPSVVIAAPLPLLGGRALGAYQVAPLARRVLSSLWRGRVSFGFFVVF